MSTAIRATLAELDGLSIKDSSRMPHPVDLARWSERGWFRVDLDRDAFRLTELGKQRIEERGGAA